MPVWSIILLCVLGAMVIAFIILMIIGRKKQKQQEEQQAQMEQQAQTMSLFIIDKKKLPLKDSGLPKIVYESSPKLARLSKVPIIKVKVANRVMNMVCDAEVFKTLLPNQVVKAKVSGIYVLSAKYERGPVYEPSKDKSAKKKMDRWLDKLR